MNTKEIRIIKEKILHYLCDDWNNHKKGRGHKENFALFDKKYGYCNYCNIDLEDVMDKIIKGLYVGMTEINNSETNRTSMYNSYQNRYMQAREEYNRAIQSKRKTNKGE